MDGFPVRLIGTGHSVCTEAWTTRHRLKVPYFRIYWIMDGAGGVTLSGKQHDLIRDFIYFIPGNQFFINHCPERMEVCWLHGEFTDLRMEMKIAGELRKWHFAELAFFEEIFKRPPALGGTELQEQDSDRFGAYSLLAWIMDKMAVGAESENSLIPFPLLPAIEHMDRNFTKNPPLEKLASCSNLAPVYFHRVFKRHLGITPHQYMERKRMSAARNLLVTTRKTPAEIAAESGYENVFYFYRVFKNHFSITPGQLRRLKFIV